MFTAIQLRKELNMTCNYTDNASATTVQNVSGKAFQGEIWLADLGEKTGSIEYGIRPVLIIQNNIGNHFSTTTIVAPLTARYKKQLPVHFNLNSKCGLMFDSIVLIEQITTINQAQLIVRIGRINKENYSVVRKSITESFKGIFE